LAITGPFFFELGGSFLWLLISPRKGSRAINAKDPSKIYKDTKTIPNGQINNQRKLPPSSKKKGPVIAKPVQRQQSPVKLPAAPQASPKTSKI
jgi:hypothetical protein